MLCTDTIIQGSPYCLRAPQWLIQGLCAGKLNKFPKRGIPLGPGGSGRPRVRPFRLTSAYAQHRRGTKMRTRDGAEVDDIVDTSRNNGVMAEGECRSRVRDEEVIRSSKNVPSKTLSTTSCPRMTRNPGHFATLVTSCFDLE